MTRAVLLSVHPRYAHALLDGTKTAEVRRRFPRLETGTTVFLYSSTPDRAVLGTVMVHRTVQVPVGEVWTRYGDVIDIERGSLRAYLRGAPHATILEMVRPQRWNSPVSLASLRQVVGVEPAQSFRYLDVAAVDALEPSPPWVERRQTGMPGGTLLQAAAALT